MDNESRIERQPVALRFLTQDGYSEDPQRQIEYELLYVEKGRGRLFFTNSAVFIDAGDLICINPFEEHYFNIDSTGPAFRCFRILFDISALGTADDPCRIFFEGIRLYRFLKMPEELEKRYFKISAMEKNAEGSPLILRSLLLDIISYAVETGQFERFSQLYGSESRKLSAIDNALHFIRENYSENLSLKSILELTNYSKSHFIRLFKESTGMYVSEYINKYRIEKACLDLIYTNNNITEIATASGFNNIQYFSRKFKEYMKCTPKQYQKKRRKLTERTVVE
ncbi:AraC family transcriptional regulator [Treponema bryantii]|uniref:AraC family transcriptional regulator n=1 Tax=Treponema bryantii TaxID=163 RepID=UPI0003B5A226|nr:AraC family transcriptional regulator [Treponema bryantii]